MSVYRTYPNANAGSMSEEERAAWVERVQTRFAEKRSRGEIEGAVAEVESVAPEEVGEAAPTDALGELERDANAGRVLKIDLRLSAEEKLQWGLAARALGLSVSEFIRDTTNAAADEVLAPEPVEV